MDGLEQCEHVDLAPVHAEHAWPRFRRKIEQVAPGCLRRSDRL
jgi:hypothetical protein